MLDVKWSRKALSISAFLEQVTELTLLHLQVRKAETEKEGDSELSDLWTLMLPCLGVTIWMMSREEGRSISQH